MTNTTTELMEQVVQDPTTIIVLSVVVMLSEILPLLPIKQNGILHTLITVFHMILRKE